MISIAAFKDNTLIGDPLGALSNGGNRGIFVGRVNAAGLNRIRRAVIAFDLSAIPAGSTITSVQLRLKMERAASLSGSRATTLHEMLGDWGEGTASDATGGGGGGAPANPGDATWLDQFKGSDPWTTPGSDFFPTPSASLSIPTTPGFYTFASTAELVADVQGWLDAPGTNFGWMIRGDESEARTARRFASRNSPVSGDHPTLLIEFSPLSMRLPGDVDDDGDIDRADLARMAEHWGQFEEATKDEGDFSGDGKVGLADLVMLQSHFGQMETPAGGHPSVPEPAGWTAVLSLAVALLTRVRRTPSPTILNPHPNPHAIAA
jgi:hypothetical protein